MIDFTKWKIYQNGILKFPVDSVSLPTNREKGALLYFETSRTLANFALGDQIQVVMPTGTPVYHCRVTGLSEKPSDNQVVQVQAAITSVDSSGIR